MQGRWQSLGNDVSSGTDVERAHELACWRWVRSSCRELRIDDVARSEVARRIAVLENELLRDLASFSRASGARERESWYSER